MEFRVDGPAPVPGELLGDPDQGDSPGVRVGAPKRNNFVRVGSGHIGPVCLYRCPDDRSYFLFLPDLAERLPDDVGLYWLFRYVQLDGAEGLWPIRAAKKSAYSRGMLHQLALGRESWVRYVWSAEAEVHKAIVAVDQSHDPCFSQLGDSEILESGFDGRIVNDENHPLIRSLRGVV